MIKPRSLKHIKRYRQIISVFTKYGLRDFVSYIKTIRLPKPAARLAIEKETAVNLRLALQELGPTFIKVGQLLSSRSDLVPKVIGLELQKLLDEVETIEFSAIKTLLEDEYNEKLENIFASVDEQPLASASLAQVYKARLKSGEEVALKVQRPGVRKKIDTDIDILYDVAASIQNRISYSKAYNLVALVKEFEKNIHKELDFELEGLNMETITENISEFKEVKIPNIYWKYSTKKILCMEFMEGFKINQKTALEKSGLDRKNLAWKILDVYSKQIYVDGFFQSDPHIGNIIINNSGRIQLIDFGSVGQLDENMRREIATLIFHIVFKEGEQAAESLVRLGSQRGHCDYTALRNDVSATIAEFTNKPAKFLSIGHGILDMTRLASEHNIELPASFSSVGKTFLLLDFMARTLDPTFDYRRYLQHIIPVLIFERLKSDYSGPKLIRNVMESSKLASDLPSKINFFIDKVLKDEFHVIFQHEGLEKVTRGVTSAGLVIGLSLVAAGLSIISILSFFASGPILAWIVGSITFALLVYLAFRMLRKINWSDD